MEAEKVERGFAFVAMDLSSFPCFKFSNNKKETLFSMQGDGGKEVQWGVAFC